MASNSTPDLVERLRQSGLFEVPENTLPIKYFEAGGDAGDSGDGGTGAASSATGGDPGPGAAGETNGSIGDSVGITATPIAASLAEAQASLGVTPTEASMMSQSNQTGSNVATNGMTASELGLLSSVGLGNADISESQTVDQALAAMSAHSAMNNNLPAILGLVNPGLASMVSMAQGLQGLVSGQVSLGQTAVNTAMSMVSQSLGIPVGVVSGVVNGNPGQAVSASTSAAIGQAFANAVADVTGIPASVVSSAMGITGVTGAIGQGITSGVNSALGVSPSGQTNTSAAASAIDGAIGSIGSPGSSTSSASASTGDGPNSSSETTAGQDTATVTADAGKSTSGLDMNTLMALIGSNQGAMPAGGEPSQENAADVQLMRNIFGTNLSAPPAGDLNAQAREIARLLRS